MKLRNGALLFMVFAVLVFLLPMVALVGGPDLSVELPPRTSEPDGGTDADPQNSAWPYTPDQIASTPDREEADPVDMFWQEGEDEGGALPVYAAMGRDTFRYYDLGDNTVKTISARDYVRGALAAEMPASFHMEALKAQAVSAHTYALYCAAVADRGGNGHIGGADFTANPGNREGFITESQAADFFGDQYDYYWSRICEAADAVFDYVLVYEEEPILAAYHASSAGITEAADNVWPNAVPYLVPVQSEGDPLSPGYSTTVSMSVGAVETALRDYFGPLDLSGDPGDWIEPLAQSPSGYMTLVRVGDREEHGIELRYALSLRSSAVEISYASGVFEFTTTGYGHGVGLSQYGADHMARQGDTFETIVTHYYPGAALALLA